MLSKDTDRTIDVQKQVEITRQLFLEQGAFIYSIIRYVLSDSDSQDDFFNELFIFFVYKPVPQNVQNLKGYLYKVICDKVVDWQRKQFRYQHNLREYAQEKAAFSAGQKMNDCLYDERMQKVLKVIDEFLSKKEAEAVRLRYRDHRSLGQIAELMDVKPHTVKKYISIGLKKIRTILGVQGRVDHDEGE
ncbi:MAG: sigma-70 family RNA polymerase sigma factor [Anaerohalosphaeraceae bacterium]